MRTLVSFCLVLSFVLLSHGRAVGENMRLEDRAQIAEQVAKYAQVWDRKDVEAFSKLFTEDAVIEWHFANASEQPPALKGRENILQYGHKAQAERLAGRQSRHHFSNLIFEDITATSALTEHMFMVTHVTPNDPPVVRSTGVYRIEWRKTDEGWLMSHRKLFIDRRAD